MYQLKFIVNVKIRRITLEMTKEKVPLPQDNGTLGSTQIENDTDMTNDK